MKTNNSITVSLFFVFILLSTFLNAQNNTSIKNAQNNTSIKKVYFDLSLGGIILPDGSGFNAHLGTGYQISSFVGIGVSLTSSTNVNDLYSDSFSGIGLDYRVNRNRLFAKFTSGIVTDYIVPADLDRYDYIGKKDLFYRLAIGFTPRIKFLNVGIVLNAAKGTFNYYQCDIDGSPNLDCEFKGVVTERMISPQLFFGIKFPRFKRK